MHAQVRVQVWAQVQAEERARLLSPSWTDMELSKISPPEPFLVSLGSGQVKRAVVQVISAMAHHGYLEQPGGEAMIEYIVQQCALPPETEVRECGLTHLLGPQACRMLEAAGHLWVSVNKSGPVCSSFSPGASASGHFTSLAARTGKAEAK